MIELGGTRERINLEKIKQKENNNNKLQNCRNYHLFAAVSNLLFGLIFIDRKNISFEIMRKRGMLKMTKNVKKTCTKEKQILVSSLYTIFIMLLTINLLTKCVVEANRGIIYIVLLFSLCLALC